MSSLLAALANGGNALRQFEKAVTAVQSNVVNASTPGYAAQQLQFTAAPFSPDSGLYGGVEVNGIGSTRDEFAEAAVRRQASQEGFYGQRVQTMSSIESAFDVGTSGGLTDTMQSLFNAFSAWAQQPNDANTQQQVIAAAGDVAVAFRQTAQQIQNSATDAIQQAQTQVAKINAIGAQIAQINRTLQQSGNAVSDNSDLYSKLEDLSAIASFTVTRSSDNTVTVLLNGQVPLVIGEHSYQLQAGPQGTSTPGSPPSLQITDASGQDVTSQFTTGSLGAIVQSVNQDVASLLGGNGTVGSLNQLAMTFANRVNSLLMSGTNASGASGAPLFQVSGDGSSASTLSLTDITPDQLAAVDPGPPAVANGIAAQLSGLNSSSNSQDQVNGLSYMDFYGQITSQVGSTSANAQTNQSRYSQLASQARSLRSEVSGVSLDEEAVRLVEFQRAYDATARTVTTINQMMDTLMQIGQ
jgi:flagellar hook-associated protein 1 FlgK